MQVNLTTNYAVRIIIFLSQQNRPVTSKRISEEIGVSPEFVQNIIRRMKNEKGLVDVKRGTFGGYTLAKSPVDIKLSDIFDAMDDNVIINRDNEKEAMAKGEKNILRYYTFLQSMVDKALSVNIKEVTEGNFRVFR